MSEDLDVPPARDPSVAAVLVSHHPDLALLRASLDALAAQAGWVVVVDNASPGPGVRAICAGYRNVEFVPLPENRGLAAALNEGVAHARARPRVSHVLLMDQDSVPETGMVDALKRVMDRLTETRKVAAVGPRFRDPREASDAPFVRIRFPVNRQLLCDGDRAEVACDFLITSGSLIPLAVLDAVGGMEEGLFIDNVDLEWCFRATDRGYALFGVCDARMLHHHGAERQRVPGLPRGIVVHTPQRLFYMMRNRVLLYRRTYTPARWVAQDLPRMVVKLLLFSLLVRPRRANLRWMLRGLRAGLRGQTGALRDADPDRAA
ncbi:MAG TPA: glycosyltransferase family 2 protein [Rhodanobacteraceae bacterium]|nr:glycosyltransferase family 2 protein [Rhodanobacteraceae bacterium]